MSAPQVSSLKFQGELEYLLSLLAAHQKLARRNLVEPKPMFPRGETGEAVVILAAQIRQRRQSRGVASQRAEVFAARSA